MLFMHRILLPLLAVALSGSVLAVPTQPNVVLILADDLGWADTTLYGHTSLYKTPNLERLAARGMTFTRAYSASPLCSPTRSAVLTGLSPARTGITTPNCHLPQVVLNASQGVKGNAGMKAVQPNPVTRLNTDYPTLPKTLKAAGYATAHFGKWHLGPEPYSPLEHAFDVDIPHHPGPGPAGSYVAPWKFKDFDFDPGVPDQHIEDRMAEEAVEWMEKVKEGPFFMNYWMFSVHAPFDAKKALIEKYRSQIDPTHPQRSPTYAAMVESMDDAVGTLLDALDRLGIADHTMIIFSSDNGGNMYNEVDGTTPTSNSPLRGGKATMFEGGVRMPQVIAWPGVVEAGSRSDLLTQSEDFFPTLLDALALKAEEGQLFDGVSILPTLKGETQEHPPIFQYFPHNPPVPDWIPPSVSVHQGDWKLIRLFYEGEAGAHRYMLFNLADDIGEKRNLAREQPERVKELDALIEGFLNETGAVTPVPNPDFDPAKYHPENEGKAKPKTTGKAKAKAGSKASAKKADESDPALKGWKIRKGEASVQEGIVTMTSNEAGTYLGVGAGVEGPAKATIRIRAKIDGTAHAAWVPPGGKEETVDFEISAGDWSEVAVDLPASGPLGLFRIYMPADAPSLEVDSVELVGRNQTRRWDF